MKLCFWWDGLSPHQAAYVRALAAVVPVTVVAERALSAGRRAQGWSVPSLRPSTVVVAPSSDQAQALLDAGSETIHVLQGFRGCRLSEWVLRNAPSGGRLGIISEAMDPRGLKGNIRRLVYRFLVESTIHKVDFVLGMGGDG